MTSELLERENPAEEQPEGEALPEASESSGEAPETAEVPELPEKTVFAPSVWERRRASAADAGARREEQRAQKAQRETDRQQEAADREAKKLELQLAREERKARDEERRAEQKRLDEERRQERKAREEEERMLRREEKAKQKTVRRVGTMTLGLSLIAIGGAVLLYMVNPDFDLRITAYLAPVILIGLGLETLIRYFFSKDRTYRFDFASGVICILLVIGSFFIALIPELMYYVSPRRYAAEDQLLQGERDKLYQAFRGEQRIADYYVNGGVEASLPSAHKDERGNWVYELRYLQTHITLLDGYASEEDFARVCRELMDKMAQAGAFRERFFINFSAPENGEGIAYQLHIENPLQAEMEPAALAKLVAPIYSEPTSANGWYPWGYSDIANQYGLTYADHYTYLLENYSEESASIYFNLLINDERPDWAENYFVMVTGQGEGDAQESGSEDSGIQGEPEEGGEEPPESESQPAPAAESAPAAAA